MLKYSLFPQSFMKVLIKFYIAVADALETAPKFDMEEIEENTVVYNFEEEEAPFVVHNLGNGQWTITGKKIERIVSMTSLVSDDAIKRLSIKMRNMGN